jgi:fructosamine-3-kinase
MTPAHINQIEQATGSRVIEVQRLNVGFGLTGMRVKLSDGRNAAVKAVASQALADEPSLCAADKSGSVPSLALEGYMLGELKRLSELPVPEVYYVAPDLLIMEWIDNDRAAVDGSAQRHAAELLAQLHELRFPRFGFERDTVIGPLHQPNPSADAWLPFFRDHRLLHMATLACNEAAISPAQLDRIERLADRLGEWLLEPPHPSLIHGDMWNGNVLVRNGKIAGFVDPAIYFAHPEIELAFSTMFGTFGAPFFEVYHALRPIEPGFHETRCAIYNIYPALVHVRLFGGSYWGQIDSALKLVGL